MLATVALVAGVCVLEANAQGATARVGSARIARVYARFDQGPLNGSTPMRNLLLVLQPGAKRRADLLQFTASQQDPHSPHYHKWLTPRQFGERFGVSASDADAVVSWLESAGMTGVTVANGRMFVRFSGTADAVSRAFQTELHTFDVAGVQHYANLSAPAVPSGLSSLVSGVVGLDDFGPAPQAVRAQPQYATGPDGFTSLAPGDLAAIYDINGLYAKGITGAGVKVAVLGRTPGAPLLSDYRSYRQTFGLPANDFTTVVAFNSSSGSTAQSDIAEATLDLEIVGAVARNAEILYVWGDTVDLAAYAVVDYGLAQVMSESYAGCESPDEAFYQTLALQANAEGVTWVSAAGDSGAAGCDASGEDAAQDGLAVALPADAPSVTAVGGTTLASGAYWGSAPESDGATASSYVPESGWSSSSIVEGGGGGISQLYGKPGFQSDFLTSITSGRMLPDIALAASPDFAPYYVVLNGEANYFGGTSGGTPLFSGIVALVNQYLYASGSLPALGLGNINPVLYRLDETDPSSFHDVTAGSNDVPCLTGSPDCADEVLGYGAGPGYDLATGLGSVDAAALAANWTHAAFTPSTATVSASASQVTAGQFVTIAANVESASGPVAGSPVQFYLTNPSSTCNQSSMLLLATVATNQSGAAVLTTDSLPAGVNTLDAYATGTTSVSAAAPVTTTVTVVALPSATALQPAPGPYQAGQVVSFNVQVSVPGGASLFGPDQNGDSMGGQVSLYSSNGTLQSGPVTVSEAGAATLATNALGAGDNGFYVIYSGNCYIASSQSPSVDLNTSSASSLASTTTSLTVSPTQVDQGGSITLTATVTGSSDSTAPTGTVTFLSGDARLGTSQLNSSGTAVYSYTGADPGTSQITAAYNGDAHFAASTSPAVSLTVASSSSPDFTLAGQDAVTVSTGSSVTVQLEITPENGFSQAIQLSCAGLPDGASCSLPGSVTPTSPITVTMTVSATAACTALGLPFGMLLTFFAPGRNPKSWPTFILFGVCTVFLAGCGGGVSGAGSAAYSSKTYPVTITATSGAITRQYQVNVTIAE